MSTIVRILSVSTLAAGLAATIVPASAQMCVQAGVLECSAATPQLSYIIGLVDILNAYSGLIEGSHNECWCLEPRRRGCQFYVDLGDTIRRARTEPRIETR